MAIRPQTFSFEGITEDHSQDHLEWYSKEDFIGIKNRKAIQTSKKLTPKLRPLPKDTVSRQSSAKSIENDGIAPLADMASPVNHVDDEMLKFPDIPIEWLSRAGKSSSQMPELQKAIKSEKMAEKRLKQRKVSKYFSLFFL